MNPETGARRDQQAANKELVRRFYDALNRQDLAAVDDLTAPDVVVAGPAAGLPLRQFVTELCTAFPDDHSTIDELLADADKVIARWRCDGTHTGPYRGLAATGRRFHDSGIDLFQVRDGRITAWWRYDDEVGLLLQLGVFRRGPGSPA